MLDHASILEHMFGQTVSTLYRSCDLGVVIRAVPLIEDLTMRSVSLFETLVSEIEWPGTVNEGLRVRADDPGDWWMHFTPTVSLVCTLYGLKP
jgi:hypothetical protein